MPEIIDKNSGEVLFRDCRQALTFFQRLIGLMFKKEISSEEALVFFKAQAIHTLFMRFSLDILFADRDMKVIKIVRNLKPLRFTMCRDAYCCVECRGGTADSKKIKEGAILALKCI